MRAAGGRRKVEAGRPQDRPKQGGPRQRPAPGAGRRDNAPGAGGSGARTRPARSASRPSGDRAAPRGTTSGKAHSRSTPAGPPPAVRPPPLAAPRVYRDLGERGPWLVRCAPGLARVATTELRFRKVLARSADPTILRQRNHDLLFLPRSAERPPGLDLRVPEEVHYCPLFGRFKISQAQLTRLATLLRAQERPFRLAVTADGAHFPRQETRGWLDHQLRALGVPLTADPAVDDILWLFCIDEAYYFGLPRSVAADAPLRERRVGERPGSLPPTIAAALAFLGEPRAGDTVLDPVCGTGTLLAEAHAYAPEATVIGVDVDRAALDDAARNLAHIPQARLRHADGARTGLPDGSVSLFLGNLPFGKQFGSRDTNRDLYAGLLAEIARLAKPGQSRAALLTADTASFDEALASLAIPTAPRRVTVKVRGEAATIYVITLQGAEPPADPVAPAPPVAQR